MKKEDLSIIMVGKLNNAAMTQLEYYKSIASCIISCWDNDNLDILKKYNLDGVHVIINNSKVQIPPGPGSMFYQATTACNALAKVHTKFVIKTRIDESFSNLEPLIQMMETSPNKIVSGSPHFAKTYFLPYHAGDHFYGCRTKIMRPALYIIKKAVEKQMPKGSLFNCDKFMFIDRTEQIVTRALLYCNGERDFSREIASEVMKRNFEICQLRKLGSIHYTDTGGCGTVFFPNGSVPDGFCPCCQEPCFESINDI